MGGEKGIKAPLDFDFSDLIDPAEAEKTQDAFAEATGVASIIVDAEGNPITKGSRFYRLCRVVRDTEQGAADCAILQKKLVEKAVKQKKPYHQKCPHTDFVEACVPIFVEGKHVASWVTGQCKLAGARLADGKRVGNYGKTIGADVGEMMAAYEDMPQITLEQFLKVLDLFWLYANQLGRWAYGNLALAREVADRKQAEEELRRHRQHLKELVEERTADLERTNKILKTEIIQHRQVAEALKESEERYRSVVQAATDAMITISQQGNIIAWNPGAEYMFGYSAAEIEGKTVSIIIPEGSQDGHRKGFERLMAVESLNLGNPVIEGEALRKDGTRFSMELSIGAWKTREGRYFIAVIRDITERKLVEEALRKSEERLRSIFDNAIIGMYRTTPAGEILVANPALVRMLGHSSLEELAQRNLEEDGFDPAYSRLDFKRRIEEEGRVIGSESGWKKSDGTVLFVRESAIPVRDEAGNTLYYEGTVEDITARKQAEGELEKYRAYLEELVKARTRELEKAHKELVHKERLATLGKLTATISHEIRNPLGTVRTSVFSISDALADNEIDRVDRALKLAERNIIRCDNIIAELLDFSRRRILRFEAVDIDAWLGELLDEQSIPGDVACTRELHAGVEVRLDREHLRRAVENVIANAVQAIRDKGSPGGRMTVFTTVSGDRVEITIKDTGCGIPEDTLGKIFEPLFSTKTFGVGLSMAIVKNIIEEHGGGVGVKSSAGKGTAVTLWLPVPPVGGEQGPVPGLPGDQVEESAEAVSGKF